MAEYILLRKIEGPPPATPVVSATASGTVTTTSSAVATPFSLSTGTWSEVQLGPGNNTNARRVLTPTVGMYPSTSNPGITFWIDDVLNRNDPTGEQEGSVFHFYPAPDLFGGEVLRGEWEDENGIGRTSIYNVPNPAPIDPSASGTIGVVGSAVGPRNTTYPVNYTDVGPTGPFTKFFGGVTINQSWLTANNGGSLVLENVSFSGGVVVEVNNLTIRNFEVTGGTFGIDNGVYTGNPTTGLVCEDGEILNCSTSGFLIENATVRRCRIRNMGADAFKPWGNCLIEECYITDLGYITTSHADGVQIRRGNDVIVRACNFEMIHNEPGYKNSQVFMIQTSQGEINNFLIEDCRINGGGYSVNCEITNNPGTGLIVRNNVFGRGYLYGLLKTGGWTVDWTGNKWEDTGLAAP